VNLGWSWSTIKDQAPGMSSETESEKREEGQEQEDPLIEQVLDRRYRIISRIGEGGIGAVYAAEHVQLQRKVAVKVLHAAHAKNTEFRQRFEREALAASKSTHPSCVAVLDLGTAEGDRPYIVMEYAEGQLLTDRLDEGSLGLAEAVDIVLQLLEALKHAHAHGIVHRDVKPDNIMLCAPERTGTRVKLLDFGLAKNLVKGAPGSHAVTQYGTVCGTPSYMSPEQGVGGEADTRSDLYSAGVVLFLVTCGRKPFTHDNPLEQIKAHLTEPPPPARSLNPAISQQLDAVIARALVKDRNERFQTAEQFIQALRRVPETTGAEQAVPAVAGIAAADTIHADGVAATLGEAIEKPGTGPRRRLSRPLFYGLLAAEGLAAVGLVAAVVLLYHDPATELRRAVGNEVGFEPSILERSPTSLLLASELLTKGKLGLAEKHAREAVKQVKEGDGRAHLVLGHIFYRKAWLSDAIKQYARALRRDPGLRDNPVMLHNVIGALHHPKVVSKARAFLVDTVGAAALPALREAAAGDRDPVVRRQARVTIDLLEKNPTQK
jgi:serine/threonine-protein kinase